MFRFGVVGFLLTPGGRALPGLRWAPRRINFRVMNTLYSRRPTAFGGETVPNDFIFRYDGADVGRCYLRGLTGGTSKWWWTIYITGPGRPSQRVPGIPIEGSADTIEQAQDAFKVNFDKLIEAGVVSDPRE